MRRKEQEVTDKSIIEKILTGSEICRVAINDEEYPYIVPMNYGYSDNALYFHSAAAGEKIDLIKKNNKVCFEIEYAGEVIRNEDPCKWSTRYLSIIGSGEIEIINDTSDKKRGLDIIMKHYGNTAQNEYNVSQVNNLVILKLTINKLTAKRSGNWVDL
jgi:nitroimidazol reductase NimA-like FMN-containing flavoprotein (pyridoxamine 5'-phosphate oxidase superfamily)